MSASPVMRTLDLSGATSTDVLINGSTTEIKKKIKSSLFEPFNPYIIGQIHNNSKRGTLFVRFKFKSQNSIYKGISDRQILYRDAYYEGNTEVWRFLLPEKYAHTKSHELSDHLGELGEVVKMEFVPPDHFYDPYVKGFLNFQFSNKVLETLEDLWKIGYFDFPRTNNSNESSQILDVSKAYISKLSRKLQAKVLETVND